MHRDVLSGCCSKFYHQNHSFLFVQINATPEVTGGNSILIIAVSNRVNICCFSLVSLSLVIFLSETSLQEAAPGKIIGTGVEKKCKTMQVAND